MLTTRLLGDIFGGIIAEYVQVCDETETDCEKAPESDLLNTLITRLKFNDAIDGKLSDYSCSKYMYPGFRWNRTACERFCQNGCLEGVKYMYALYPEYINQGLYEAALSGQTIVLLWLLNRKEFKQAKIQTYFSLACLSGHVETAKEVWKLIDETTVKQSDLKIDLQQSCSQGRLEVVQWLIEKFNLELSPNHFRLALSSRNLEFLKWFKEVKPDARFDKCDFVRACENGTVDIVKWMVETWPAIDREYNHFEAYKLACLQGNEDIVRFLLDDNLERLKTQINYNVLFVEVCKRGHVSTAKILSEIFQPETRHINSIYSSICQKGCKNRLAMISWLLTKYPTEEPVNFFHQACCNGRIDIAEWLFDRFSDLKCPEETLDYCQKNGLVGIVEWIKKNFNLHKSLNF